MRIKHSIECWIASPCEDGEKLLLLVVAASNRHPAFLQPITGGIEEGETPSMACIREIHEETGLSVQDSQLIHLSGVVDVPIDDSLMVRKTLFAVRLTVAPITINPREHIGYCWVPVAHVASRLWWESNQRTWAAVQRALLQ